MEKVYASGYSEAGASYFKRAMRDFTARSLSAIEDIDNNNRTLRQRARMLYMSGSVGTSAINSMRTKIVGTGLTLETSIDAEFLGLREDSAVSWQKKTEAEFKLWAGRKNCDALGTSSFNAIQQLVLKSWLMSGDCFVVLKSADPTPLNPYSLRLHVIEADRVCTPTWARGGVISSLADTEGIVPEDKPGAGRRIHDGVEVDENGLVTAYYICDRYPDSALVSGDTKWVRIEAVGEKTGMPNVLHIMESERPDQYRGVPLLTPVIEACLQLRRYTESELMSALVQSFFTAWIETETDKTEFPFNDVGPTEGSGREEDARNSENEYQMGPGTVVHLDPGEKVQFGSPQIPTAGFDTFVKTISRSIGAALEIPYEVLLKEFTSSYSASRGALLEAWEAFKMRRVWLVEDFCQPVYERWLAEAVARGRVIAPGFFDDPLVRSAWCGAQWIGPVQGQLDPKKEAEAALALASYGVKTYEQITRELGGGDFRANAVQLGRENDLLKEAGAAAFEMGPDEDSDPEDGEE